MSYHPDHATNDVILCVINDGNGSQCGYSYDQRIELARRKYRLLEFRHMARNYIRYASQNYGTPHPHRTAWIEAGNYLQKYYEELVEEIDNDAENERHQAAVDRAHGYY